MSKRIFRNKFAGVKCSICQQTIAIGAEFSWDRSAKAQGKTAAKWHLGCDKDGRLEAMNAGMNEDEDDGNEAVATPKPQTSAASAGSWLEGLAEQLIPLIDGKLSTSMEGLQAKIDAFIEEKMQGMVITKLNNYVIENKDAGVTIPVGIQHKQFGELLDMCRVRHEDDSTHLNILLVGPAGTGKTYVAKKIAEALGRPFYFTGMINTEYKLLGFIDAQGRVICPAFRKAWVEGGVFLFDEIWRSLPAALMPFNTALSGDMCDFPDGCFKRHPDFLCLAADNTYGLGGDTKYTGNKQDASVLNRFVKFKWDIDEDLEAHITQHPAWIARVQQLRASAKRKGLDVLITPRQSRSGAAMLRQGIPQARVEQVLIACDMSEDQWRNLNA